jgi:DNA-binding beta-propeller fold protein YncE
MIARCGRVWAGLFAVGLLLQPTAAQEYHVYVAAESEDEVALIKFDGTTAVVEQTVSVGTWPTEIEGPHGLTVSPDGRHWYVTLAHGLPFGSVLKYETETNQLVGRTELGLFPATMQISPATGLLYVVNFNLHGDMVPSTVSVVDPETMIELARTETGVMPHGSRLSPDGMRHYSVAMMSGHLYEIDAASFRVLRTLSVDQADHKSEMVGTRVAESATDRMSSSMAMSTAKPTWVISHPTERKVYVACNGSDQVAEVDLDSWTITRRLETGAGPYNLDVTPDGSKLVVSYKKAGSTGIWDLGSGTELAEIPNSRKVSHGVTVSPDGMYAFVSVEGIGGEPGSVDVIDLDDLTIVATAEIGKQAGGIYFWKMGG